MKAKALNAGATQTFRDPSWAIASLPQADLPLPGELLIAAASVGALT